VELLIILLPFLAIIFLVNRGSRQRQRQFMQLQDAMAPGVGVRTRDGLYAQVKEVRDDTVMLEVAPGLHAVYARGAIAVVLEEDEYQRIVSGEPEPEPEADEDAPVVPDDASSLTETEEAAAEADESEEPDEDEGGVDLGKPGTEKESADDQRNAKAEGENGSRS
jgi:preprotein translocase subunit YajC